MFTTIIVLIILVVVLIPYMTLKTLKTIGIVLGNTVSSSCSSIKKCFKFLKNE